MKPKKRKKWLYVVLIIAGLWTIGLIQMLVEKSNSPPPRKSTQTTKPVPKQQPVPKHPIPTYKPSGIVFTKTFISLNAVKKYPKLKTETEQLAYWYRYNVSAAALYHKKPEKAGEYNRKFKTYKHVLGEKRFYEIMNLADSDYYSVKN